MKESDSKQLHADSNTDVQNNKFDRQYCKVFPLLLSIL